MLLINSKYFIDYRYNIKMAVSYLTKQNDSQLYCEKLTSKTLHIDAIVNNDGSVASNPGLVFSNVGSAFVESGDTLRFGKNSAGAGLVMNFSSDGAKCDLVVDGTITGNINPPLRGSATWSGGGASLTVSNAGITSGHHVFVSVHTPASEPVEVSHVVAGSGSFQVNLSGSNTSNDLAFHWYALAPTS